MQVLDAVGAAQVVWLGAAWGGHIGVAAARRHPDRLVGLVVLNAPMRPWRGRRLALMRLTYLLLWAFGPRSWVAPMIANAMVSPNARPDRPAIVRAVAAALRRCHRRGLLRAARSAMFERGDVVPLLPGLTLPVLFLTGADDRLYPVEEARAQSAGIPECTFVVVERSAHQSALEAPDQVLPLLREALAAWGSRGTLQAARRGGDAGATAASRPADFVIDR
jgi:pimeloyl-ACP methyl ester carboxylesterase